MKKQVCVIGLGRFGATVARELYQAGHDILAMDTDEEKVQSMMGQVTYPVTGNGTNEAVLRELGVPDYDAAVVAVGSDLVVSVGYSKPVWFGFIPLYDAGFLANLNIPSMAIELVARVSQIVLLG